jgi:hypothetical protein
MFEQLLRVFDAYDQCMQDGSLFDAAIAIDTLLTNVPAIEFGVIENYQQICKEAYDGIKILKVQSFDQPESKKNLTKLLADNGYQQNSWVFELLNSAVDGRAFTPPEFDQVVHQQAKPPKVTPPDASRPVDPIDILLGEFDSDVISPKVNPHAPGKHQQTDRPDPIDLLFGESTAPGLGEKPTSVPSKDHENQRRGAPHDSIESLFEKLELKAPSPKSAKHKSGDAIDDLFNGR